MKYVYLDTTGWNKLVDHFRKNINKSHPDPNYNILFSSCNLDEFGAAPLNRQIELARLSWHISNQLKLLDHMEIMHQEITEYYKKNRNIIENFDETDTHFISTWRKMSQNTFSFEISKIIAKHIEMIKRDYNENSKVIREILKPSISNFKKLGFTKSWDEMRDELYREGNFIDFIHNAFKQCPEFNDFPDLNQINKIDIFNLPLTAVGIQYQFANQFYNVFGEGRKSRPSTGDQYDVRHSYYAGLVDIFVTDDEKMHYILSNMILNVKAEIFRSNELINLINIT